MVTDQQVRRLRMLVNMEQTRAIAAAKAGMSEKTAIIGDRHLFPITCILRPSYRQRMQPAAESLLELLHKCGAPQGSASHSVFTDN